MLVIQQREGIYSSPMKMGMEIRQTSCCLQEHPSTGIAMATLVLSLLDDSWHVFTSSLPLPRWRVLP